MIEHPPGEEIQFDWVELPDPPTGWGVGSHAHLLVGALAHSGCWQAVLAESEDFPHLVQALDQVLRKLGGTARQWRLDRMATVCYPSSGQITPAFAGVAKFYGVQVAICPLRRAGRRFVTSAPISVFPEPVAAITWVLSPSGGIPLPGCSERVRSTESTASA